MTTNVTARLMKAGCVAYDDHAPLLQPPHVQLANGVYACGEYIANCNASFSVNKPGSRAAPGPRSSQICRVYVACARGVLGFACWYDQTSQVRDVAVPGIIPSVGPTGYVFPLSQTAETVRCVGVERRLVKFQAKVIVLLGAILKYDVWVCGGCVIVRPPAGADWGMLRELVDACDEPPLFDPDCWGEDELCWFCEFEFVEGAGVADIVRESRER